MRHMPLCYPALKWWLTLKPPGKGVWPHRAVFISQSGSQRTVRMALFILLTERPRITSWDESTCSVGVLVRGGACDVGSLSIPSLVKRGRWDDAGCLYILQVRILYESLLKHQEEQTRVALLEQQVLTWKLESSLAGKKQNFPWYFSVLWRTIWNFDNNIFLKD